MMWRALGLAGLLLCYSLSASAQVELSPPQSSLEPLADSMTSPSVSERLRSLAERLKQLTTDSQSDLVLLLQEREMLYSELLALETSAKDSERDLLSMRTSTESLSNSLRNSIESERREALRKRLWRGATGVSLIVIVVESVLLIFDRI